MDLVDFDEEIFERISDEFTDLAAKLAIPDLTFIPISALHGDNVTEHSPNTPVVRRRRRCCTTSSTSTSARTATSSTRASRSSGSCARCRTSGTTTAATPGEVAGGIFRPGDEVMVLPSGLTTTIAGIDLYGEHIDEAMPPQSVTMRLADNLDVSRGDMICRPHNAPTVTQEIDAMVCWFSERPLQARSKYVLKHTTRSVQCLVRDLTTASTSTRSTGTRTPGRSP